MRRVVAIPTRTETKLRVLAPCTLRHGSARIDLRRLTSYCWAHLSTPWRVALRRIGLVLLTAVLVLPGRVLAHGGGLDAHGCHHDRKRGGYHCHRGMFVGRSFDSQAAMLEEKAKTDGDKDGTPGRSRPKREPATGR